MKSSTGSVAVVVTCFNLGRTLEEAVDSVLQQTSPPREIVIVDDGSNDIYTRQVLTRLQGKGLRVVGTENRGVSAARNTGIRLTTSGYVVLLDADDALRPSYLEKAASYLDSHAEMAFVSSGMECFGAITEIWTPPDPALVRTLAGGAVHISSMFRREVWETAGGFDERLYGHEEVDFWASVLERGFVGGVLQEPLLRYRVRRGSMYQRAIQSAAHADLMATIYRKHSSAVESHAEELLLAKERFIIEQESHRSALHARRDELNIELHQLNDEIAQVSASLEQAGVPPIEFGDLRRLTPLSPVWGTDRGIPLDRYYIESFLWAHREDIRGRVLEVKDAGYTRAFGADGVAVSDVLDIDTSNPQATIVGDLSGQNTLPSFHYDCFILTQTLGVIYDVRRALAEAYRVLKPGGVLLCTVPAAGRIGCEEGQSLDGDFWRFTEASVRRLFAESFPPEGFEVTGFGNVLACSAFLFGLSPNELKRVELDTVDPFFPVVYGIRAIKPQTPLDRPVPTPASRRPPDDSIGRILMYHRVSNTAGVPGLWIDPDVFRAQMRHLRDGGYCVVSLSELRRSLETGGTAKKQIAITFDDGYAETALLSCEILQEFAFPATYFVIGGSLHQPKEFWWDALYRIFGSKRPLPSTFSIEGPQSLRNLATSTPAERQTAYLTLVDTFYTLPQNPRDALLAAIIDWSGGPEPLLEASRAMNQAEVLSLSRCINVAIGAHTESHLWLPSQSRSTQHTEIETTKCRLERLIGGGISSFSYPYGGANADVAELVGRTGFSEAVTTEQRAVRRGDNPTLLPRIDVSDCSASAFAARLSETWNADASPPEISGQ